MRTVGKGSTLRGQWIPWGKSALSVPDRNTLEHKVVSCQPCRTQKSPWTSALGGYVFRSVQSLSHVQLFVTPWTTAYQASLSITNSQSLPKLMSITLVMPSNNLILCHPLLLLPSIFPNIRVFSNESTLCIRWPKYWSFSFNISPSYEHPGLISFRMDCLDLLVVQGTLKSLLQRLCVHVLFAKRKSLCIWSKT